MLVTNISDSVLPSTHFVSNIDVASAVLFVSYNLDNTWDISDVRPMIYIDNNMFNIYDRLKCLKSDKNQPREAVYLRSVNHRRLFCHNNFNKTNHNYLRKASWSINSANIWVCDGFKSEYTVYTGYLGYKRRKTHSLILLYRKPRGNCRKNLYIS